MKGHQQNGTLDEAPSKQDALEVAAILEQIRVDKRALHDVRSHARAHALALGDVDKHMIGFYAGRIDALYGVLRMKGCE